MAKKLSDEYRSYIASVEWAEKRTEALRHYGYTCQKKRDARESGFFAPRCGGPLHVHHRHYRTLGNEGMDDLLVLCRKHHKYLHFVRDAGKIMKALRGE